MKNKKKIFLNPIIMGKLEALLFAAGSIGLGCKHLCKLLVLSKKDLNAYLNAYKERTNQTESGIELYEFHPDNVKLLIKKIHKDLINQSTGKVERPIQLSRALLETLAIIATKKEITRSDIAKIRGVNTDSSLIRLKYLGLIEENGHAATLGHPILYTITSRFYDLFKIKNSEDINELFQEFQTNATLLEKNLFE